MEKINGIKYLWCFFIFSAGFLLMREINAGLGASLVWRICAFGCLLLHSSVCLFACNVVE